MEAIFWLPISLFLCCGAVFLIWRLRGWFCCPVRGTADARLHAVIAAGGSPAGLEQSVNGLRWLIRSGKLDCDILIVDAGLDAEARLLARLLARDDPRIHLCSGNICFTEETWRKTDT